MEYHYTHHPHRVCHFILVLTSIKRVCSTCVFVMVPESAPGFGTEPRVFCDYMFLHQQYETLTEIVWQVRFLKLNRVYFDHLLTLFTAKHKMGREIINIQVCVHNLQFMLVLTVHIRSGR